MLFRKHYGIQIGISDRLSLEMIITSPNLPTRATWSKNLYSVRITPSPSHLRSSKLQG